jgi:NAD(P) transhydrogenase subunit alpha
MDQSRVAVLRETRSGERRVAMVPATVSKLVDAGLSVVVETGAGEAASISDQEFEEAGATIAPDAKSTAEGAGVVVKVQPPAIDEPDEVAALSSGSILISFLMPASNLDAVRRLADARVTSLAMDAVPRITRAQKMDALSSQATVAGYKAVIIGADAMDKFLPMFMTAAGTIPPAKALVLGAGVAGLQAIATAKRLGAIVSAFDVRPAVKEQVESLGAKFLETELEGGEDEGGYAEALSEEQHKKELELLARHVPESDLVITTAAIPGKTAPVLITEEMVDRMHAGSVIVDLAAASGGNCALTRMGETVIHDGVQILGPVDLASTLPVHSSEMYARNVTALLLDMVEEGSIQLDFEDEVVAGSCIVHDGEVRHDQTRELLG